MPTPDEIRAAERMIAIARSQGWDAVEVRYTGAQPEIVLRRRDIIATAQTVQ